MQLKMQTDYAIRILLCLSQATSPVVARELSQSLGIADNYLPKITQQLRRAGWIESTSGINGGFRLLVNPADISLLDVMREMEGSVCINRCLDTEGYCSRDAVTHCPVHLIHMDFQEIFDWYFRSVTIGELTGNQAPWSVRKKRIEELKRFCDSLPPQYNLEYRQGEEIPCYAHRTAIG